MPGSTADEFPYWVGFSLLPGVGSTVILKLRQSFGSMDAAWKASQTELMEAGVTKRSATTIVTERNKIDLDAELAKLERAEVQAIPIIAENYPRALREIQYPPAILYVRGTLHASDELGIGMVGTRRATPYGRDMASRIAGDLARAGVTVVSGLALGIDGVAHRAALEAGGRTIAVCASGLDVVYPARHRELAHNITQNGALISDYPLGMPPHAQNFPARNRIISGLSRGVVVVEAPERSGALITANFAADQGRDVYAVPGSALSPMSRGCHQLIRDGATLVTSAEDLLTELQIEDVQAVMQARMILPETPDESTLYELIGAEPRHIDEIAVESGMSIHQTGGLLMALELKGLIRKQGSQHYVRS